jgi:hypothetical protein
MMSDAATKLRFDLGTVLTGLSDDRYLVVEVFPSGKVCLCRIPDGMDAKDFGHRFHHQPLPDDPTHVALTS